MRTQIQKNTQPTKISQPSRPQEDIYTTGFFNQAHASQVTRICRMTIEQQITASQALRLTQSTQKLSFASPSLRPGLKKSKALSISTEDSNQPKTASSTSQTSEKKQRMMLAAIASQDKKLAHLIDRLNHFEEECIADGTLNSSNLARFRAVSRGYLGLVVQNFPVFKTHRSRSLVLSLILLASSALGVSNQEFLFQISKVVRRNKVIKISSLKKLKSYTFLKNYAQKFGW